ncbi:hypothetical protein [Glaciibacter psychrotolerans]|uniref:DUF4386 family protein n=1 Tax=Glaciibacter psychrotolerans TaxID=670054 RepID=A0A7Z0ECU7_9MICO|nr:hypothetical protein [Leifsonia psychrotolerans]NYJ19066.1 hypothetical protein [Leifsonia psychrotolerans]
MSKFMRDAQAAWVAFAVALLGVIASVLLLLMFAVELPFNGPYGYGAGYEVLTAGASVLSAVLVLYLSRMARPGPSARVLAPALAILLIVEAAFALLLVLHLVAVEVSVAATLTVLVLEGIWLIWLNRRLGRLGAFSPFLSTFGWLIGACLTIGVPISVLGLLLPPLEILQLLVLGFGVFLAGGAWLVFSLWWLMVGVRLLRGPRNGQSGDASADEANESDSATTTHLRGRRRASIAAPADRPYSCA